MKSGNPVVDFVWIVLLVLLVSFVLASIGVWLTNAPVGRRVPDPVVVSEEGIFMRDKERKPAVFRPGRFQRADGREPASNVDIFLNTSRELMRDEQGRPFLNPGTGEPVFGNGKPPRPYLNPATGRPWSDDDDTESPPP